MRLRTVTQGHTSLCGRDEGDSTDRDTDEPQRLARLEPLHTRVRVCTISHEIAGATETPLKKPIGFTVSKITFSVVHEVATQLFGFKE